MRMIVCGLMIALSGCARSMGALPSSDAGAMDEPAQMETDAIVPGDAQSVLVPEVFANTDGKLYRLDPTTLDLAEVGPFTGAMGAIYDIAIDEQGTMVAVGQAGPDGIVYRVKYGNGMAQCTVLTKIPGEIPLGLTYVPRGTIDPNREVLVGMGKASWLRIDYADGDAMATVTDLGDFMGPIRKMNDAVGITNDAVYAVVYYPPQNNQDDEVLTLDPKTGATLKTIGVVTGVQGIGGLGYWGGKIYGFGTGLWEIDAKTGKATSVPLKVQPEGGYFQGAAVRTNAPVTIN